MYDDSLFNNINANTMARNALFWAQRAYKRHDEQLVWGTQETSITFCVDASIDKMQRIIREILKTLH